MKVLVTGGAGFIGSHVVDKLIARKYEVLVIDNLSTGIRENVNPAARFLKLDIAEDDLGGLFAAERFDHVIHLAAQTAVPKSVDDPVYDCRLNIMATVNMLEACRKTGVKRVVFASSAAVYGNVAAIPVPETAALRPTSFYGLSKAAVEEYLRLYAALHGVDYVALRYANVYGERQGDAGEGGVVSIFARKVAGGGAVDIFGDGGQTRDFVYVGDVAEANCAALVTPNSNAVYNIATCSETSVNALVDALAAVAGREIEKTHRAAREGDIYRSSLDNTLAVSRLGWKPRMPLREGLAATYRFVAGR